MELTEAQKRKLLSAAKLVESGDMAVLEKILEFEDFIDQKEEKIKEYQDVIETGIDEFKKTTEDALSRINAIEKGAQGEDYVLTEQDKKEIAQSIPVPVVEKIVEKITTVKEQPIVTHNITNEIVEVAVAENADKIRDKLESLPNGEKLGMSAIEELDETIATLQNRTQLLNQIATQGQRSSASGVAFRVTEIDGSPTVTSPTAIKFSNGSVTDNGDGTVTVTTGAGGGGDFSSNTATSVDSEIVLFSGTGGKTGKRATGTGIATLTSGVLSATATTGTGSVVLATAPTLATPVLGVATATTINKVTVTAPATASTLTIADGATLTASATATISGTHTGSSSGTNTGDQTITLTGGVTGSGTGSFATTVVTNANLTGDVTSVGNATTLTNAPVIAKVLTGYVSGAGTVAATDSILQAIQKLNGNDATNANLTGPITSTGNATAIASQTGTGTTFVMNTSPTLVTPVLGVASATSLATSAATPLLLTNGQLVNVALTSQTVGATTLTIPDFASVVDEFTFKTKAQTMSNKTFVAPALGTPASGVMTNVTGVPAAAILPGSFGAGAYVISTSLQAATIELGNATDTTLSRVSAGVIAVEGVTIADVSSTQTLTNKTLIASTNVVEEMTTTASSATPTPTGGSLRNFFSVTALAAGATFAAPSGTPANNNVLTIRIKDNGGAQTLAFNAIYRASTDLAFPTTTTASKTMYLNFRYNSADSKWDFVAQTNGF
jgi:hypothetical protein